MTATRWASQAAQNAMLRYNPQRQALAQQIREAGENYGSTVRAARSTAKQTEGATSRAIPLLQAIFSKADAAKQAGATLVSGDLAALPNTGTLPQYKAGEAGEVNTQLDNIAKQRATAESGMVERGTRAREGAQFAQLNAQNVLARTLQSLFSKGQSISGEQGAFAQSEAAKLAREAEKAEAAETRSQRSAATSRANSREKTTGAERRSERSASGAERRSERSAASKRSGGKELTPHEQNTAASTIAAISSLAGPLLKGGHSRAEIVERLQQGTPSVSGKTKAGNNFKTPAVPAYKPDVLMSAAIDSALSGGYVSPHTMNVLHTQGYSLSRLGIKGVHPFLGLSGSSGG